MANSACMAGIVTTIAHMPTLPTAAISSETARRNHA